MADNRTNEEATWDNGLLASEFLELRALDFNLSATGFDLREIERVVPSRDDREDEVPEQPEVATTRSGDLWLLGEHRLLCGDATREEDAMRVMNGEQAALLATDPPYGINYDSAELHEHGVSYAKISGDHQQDEKLQAFLEKVFAVALKVIRQDCAWYLWHAMLTQGFFAAAAAAAAHVILHRQIIWVKPVLVFGRGQFHWKHELCFMGWIKGHEPPDFSDHKDVTVWEVAGVGIGERRQFGHSTPKPVELFRRPIVKHLRHGEICYEPFAGSGPQFIAAQLSGRRCYGIEIEPKHCDVIVTRWQSMTGFTAKLDGDGRSFAALTATRADGPQ